MRIFKVFDAVLAEIYLRKPICVQVPFAIVDTEIDGAMGMNSGIFNNPFLIWGKYKKKFLKYYLPISFQFHHTQMDGAHAGKFLMNLQNEINNIKSVTRRIKQ